ncbi:MAG: methylmalonyl Co-A mutase-associated GTPase MeaB [Leeuwenhoekiella sp.]
MSNENNINKESAKKILEQRRQIPDLDNLITNLLNGNTTALSRSITFIESTATQHQEQAQQIIEACLPRAGKSLRIGITGVPGVGKSTFIEVLGNLLIKKGKKVAVLAVDPTSSISHGSILGDKTRMETLVNSKNAFIRPSASGDSLGGVARKTRESIILCEAAGYDVILVETVGVGQSEVAVHSMTDFFLLLKISGAGDELQGIKRGIIEMADAIFINKADGENIKAAKLAKNAFAKALHLYPPKTNGWIPKVEICSALHNEGIEEIWEVFAEYFKQSKSSGFFDENRTHQNSYWLKNTVENALKDAFYQKPAVKEQLSVVLAQISAGEITPFQAAQQLLKLH